MQSKHKVAGILGVLALIAVISSHAQRALPASPPEQTILIEGIVRETGRKLWTPNLTLRTALLQAGDYSAKLDRIAIIRGQERIIINVADLQNGAVADPKLQPDDLIEVPDRGPKRGFITIVRGSLRIQITRRDLKLWHYDCDYKLQPDDIVIVGSRGFF